ncbi:MAG: hypothetical protein ACRDP7_21035 [Trebonia sp.]
MAGKEPDALSTLIRKQDGVVSRKQALAAGISLNALRHRVRPSGPWSVWLPGVYQTETGTPTRTQREIAALLYCGPHSALTGVAALRHYLLPAPDSAIIDILIPAQSRRKSVSYVKVHRTARMPETLYGPAHQVCAPPARAAADAVRGLTDLRAARALLAAVVQNRGCATSQLKQELSAGPVQYSALLRSVLAEVADGVRSAPEAELRDLVKQAGLPMPLFNPRLYQANGTFIACPDAWWPEAGVAVEIDSKRWHLSPDDWERTMDRHDRLSQHSIVTLHFTPHKLRSDQAFVMVTLKNAYKSGIARPRLPIRAIPAAD